MFQEIRSDDFVIHDEASIVLDRSHQPNEEQAFDEPIEWNYFSDVEREEFNSGEASKDNPVDEPFLIISCLLRFHSLH